MFAQLNVMFKNEILMQPLYFITSFMHSKPNACKGVMKVTLSHVIRLYTYTRACRANLKKIIFRSDELSRIT